MEIISTGLLFYSHCCNISNSLRFLFFHPIESQLRHLAPSWSGHKTIITPQPRGISTWTLWIRLSRHFRNEQPHTHFGEVRAGAFELGCAPQWMFDQAVSVMTQVSHLYLEIPIRSQPFDGTTAKSRVFMTLTCATCYDVPYCANGSLTPMFWNVQPSLYSLDSLWTSPIVQGIACR